MPASTSMTVTSRMAAGRSEAMIGSIGRPVAHHEFTLGDEVRSAEAGQFSIRYLPGGSRRVTRPCASVVFASLTRSPPAWTKALTAGWPVSSRMSLIGTSKAVASVNLIPLE